MDTWRREGSYVTAERSPGSSLDPPHTHSGCAPTFLTRVAAWMEDGWTDKRTDRRMGSGEGTGVSDRGDVFSFGSVEFEGPRITG